MIREMVPWRERVSRPLVRFEREMEDLRDRFFGREELPMMMETMVPRCNVAETETAFEVTGDLPGIKPEEVHVELKNGDLWITGKSEEEHKEEGKTYHRVECRYGEYRRAIPLPTEVAAEKVEAKFKDGVLSITVPKAEEAKPKRIEVKT